MKKYELDIENVGNDTYILMSRGHHDINDFMNKCKEEYETWRMGNPQHVWCKTVPCNNGTYACLYVIVDQNTKGAWPATYCWEV